MLGSARSARSGLLGVLRGLAVRAGNVGSDMVSSVSTHPRVLLQTTSIPYYIVCTSHAGDMYLSNAETRPPSSFPMPCRIRNSVFPSYWLNLWLASVAEDRQDKKETKGKKGSDHPFTV